MALPDGNALDLLETARAKALGGEWVLLTAYGTVPDSVRALRLGAYDFLEKPLDADRVDLAVANHKVYGSHPGKSMVWWNGPDEPSPCGPPKKAWNLPVAWPPTFPIAWLVTLVDCGR